MLLLLLLLLFAGEEQEEEEEGVMAAAVMRREDIHLGECRGTGSGIGARKVCPRMSTSPFSTRTPTLPTKQQDSPACFFSKKRKSENGGRGEGGRGRREGRKDCSIRTYLHAQVHAALRLLLGVPP